MQKRCIDDTGRIVIPVDIRKQLNISNGDAILINVEDNRLILYKENKSSYNLEKAIRTFIKHYYGLKYKDVLITEVNLLNIYNYLDKYIKCNILNDRDVK